MAVHFKKSGSGPALILIHGFPMNSQVWDLFTPSLEDNYTIYTPDLPGFGSSAILPGQFSLEDVAVAMNEWIAAEQIRDPVVIGHSLGGYVALEVIRLAPATYRGLVLFHSTAYADSSEKKESRSKVLKFIDDNGVQAFTSNFIQPLFSDPAHPAIERVKALSIEAETAAVKGYTLAMRDRRDNTRTLVEFRNPILLLGGEADKGIPAQSLIEQARLRPGINVAILSDAAHMGMFEVKEQSVRQITDFLSRFITSEN